MPALFDTPVVTRIDYHPRWNLPVRTTSPTGVVSNREHDASLPLLTAVWPGTDPARRTLFRYCTGSDCPMGLLRYVARPATAAPDPPPPGDPDPPPPPPPDCPPPQIICEQPVRGRASAQSGETILQQFGYDAIGNLRWSQSATGKEQRFGRDWLGRATSDSVLVTDGGTGTTWRVTSSTYDGGDRVTEARTAAAQVEGGTQTLHVVTDYDQEDQPTRVRRWDAANAAGVGEVVDSMAYDVIGRLVRRRVPGYGSAFESMAYDAADNVIRKLTRRGHAITMTYDPLNRLETRVTDPVTYEARVDLGLSRYHQSGLVGPYPSPQWPLGSNSPTTIDGDTARFTYDPRTGELATANNRDARITRIYWDNGLLRREEQRIRTIEGQDFDTHVFTVESRYNEDGRRTAVTTPAGVYRYTYDGLTGDLRVLVGALNDWVSVDYDGFGRPAGLGLPGGVRRTFEYTLDSELARDVLRVPTTAARPLPSVGGVVRDARLTYTIDGKLAAVRGAGAVQDTLLVGYTPMGHLRTSRYRGRDMNDFGNVVLNASNDFTLFDALGNQVVGSDSTRREVAGGMQASAQPKQWVYVGDGTGRLTMSRVGEERTDHHYDAAGNIIASIRQEQAVGSGRPPVGGKDRVMFYDAADRLRVVETREAAPPPELFEGGKFLFRSDEYRYDALGRRVLVQSRREAGWRSFYVPEARRAFVRRTVWDGAREVYEIQVPHESGTREVNGQLPELPVLTTSDYNPGTPIDLNPHFGQVGYGYLDGIDQPVTVERFSYADRGIEFNPYQIRSLWRAPAFTIFPSWNAQGRADLGTTIDGGRQFCTSITGEFRCTMALEWAGYWTPYAAGFQPLNGWFGSLLEDKRDPSGLLYRRNRFVDPVSGRFTQEDPIGLAGGLNLYGFAKGDPVNYSDPFGLSDCPRGADQAKCFAETLGRMLTPWKGPLEYFGAFATLPVAGGMGMGGRGATSLGMAMGRSSATSTAHARALGAAGEAASGITKSYQRIESPTRTAAYRVPDGLTATTLSEVKNVAKLSLTNQLRDFSIFAQTNNLAFELWVRPSTQLSGPLQQFIKDQSIMVRLLP
ncbi:MAG: putative toxin [Gemmatimonadaceae bacterium]|nr:putative toxin [Gemmatimonadaceae bacterium]